MPVELRDEAQDLIKEVRLEGDAKDDVAPQDDDYPTLIN